MSKTFFNDYYEQDTPSELLDFYRKYPAGLVNGAAVLFNFQAAMLNNEELGLEDEGKFILGHWDSFIIVYDMVDYTILLRDKHDVDIVEEEFRTFEELVDWVMEH